MFVLVPFPVAGYGLGALFSGRSLAVTLKPSWQKVLTVIGLLAIGTSWSLKVFWLGN